MHVFNSADDLYYVTLQNLMRRGDTANSRLGPTKELWGISLGLTNPDCNFVLAEERKLSPVYASAELLWYLSGSERSEMIQHYAPSYAQYVEADGNDWGAYGYRLAKNLLTDDCKCNELEVVVKMLQHDPDSRQAVAMIWRPSDLYNAERKARKSTPCTICWQFLLRQGYLHMITTMRSNDAWLGLPYDLYAFTSIQRLMAGELGAKLGMYVHNVGSLHIYEKNWQKVENLLARGPHGHTIQLMNPHKGQFSLGHGYAHTDLSGLDEILAVEAASRNGVRNTYTCESPLLSDAVAICASENLGSNYHIISPLLRKAYDDYCRRKRQSRKNDSVQKLESN